jgi:hypothetical protein
LFIASTGLGGRPRRASGGARGPGRGAVDADIGGQGGRRAGQGARAPGGAVEGAWAKGQATKPGADSHGQLGGNRKEFWGSREDAVVVPSREKGERGKKFVKEEERQLARSVLLVLQDPVVGNG